MRFPILILASGLLAGCATTQPLAPLAFDESDPTVATRPVAYQSVTAGYAPGRPVEPGDWLEQNRQVAPGGES